MKDHVYRSRRQILAEKLPEQSVLVLFSGYAKTRSNDEKFLFSPNRNFLYLTGIAREKLVLTIAKRAGVVTEILYLERPNELVAKWDGAVLNEQEAKEFSGIEQYAYIDEWKGLLGAFIRQTSGKAEVFLDLERDAWGDELTPAEIFAQEFRQQYPVNPIGNASPWLKEMRMVKSADEIAEIKRAIAITDEAIRRMLAYAKPGITEYELEAHFDFVVKSHAVRELPYAPIIASGKNTTILHYKKNDRTTQDGDLVLLDVGAGSNYYAADISRTFPVNGKFTERQQEIYQLVLTAQKETIEAIKPGITISDLNTITKRVLADGLKRIGLISEDHELSAYYYHGVTHHIGLDIHDIADRDVQLLPGMVLTIEPGLYLADEAIGIRIEDDILVTESGYENLSNQIPKEIDEIEQLMNQR